ncbi:hypothetical protein CYY_001953 [Polysphondylium violaceum]|uniref:CRIB domain-containing protein n=1 Tax=Polysphondylium violaceum TaxID=133409 RepID=A0A8J4Q2E9_9MYCE|nr:hypothetical protein CYY_001953 [Polysphondylium violaceum]
MAKLLIKNQNEWEFTGLVGLATLSPDHNSIRLVDINDPSKILFEKELFLNFEIIKESDIAYSFRGDSEGSIIYALSFDSPILVSKFFSEIYNFKSINLNASSAPLSRQPKSNSGFFDFLFGKPQEDIEISSPKTFVHKSHVGWGSQGFECRDLPLEWKRLFVKCEDE